MTVRTFVAPALLAASFCVSAWAQAPSPATIPGPAAAPTDAGVARAVLLDRPQVRVLRVEIQPGATRKMHTHDDVRFHLFLPITGAIEFTAAPNQPVAATPGQAFYMDKGTLHGFRNTGTSVAMVFEVFIRDGAPAAQNRDRAEDQRDALALALAFVGAASAEHPDKTQK